MMTAQETAALNARVEREVFGRIVPDGAVWYRNPDSHIQYPVRNFLSDGNAMLALIAKLYEYGYHFELEDYEYDPTLWRARFWRETWSIFDETAATIPHAVALAALRAVEGERE